MSRPETWLVYHLPRTRVRVRGTVSEHFDLRRDEAVRTVHTEVALEVGADPSAFYRIDARGARLAKETLGLELAEDGRLTSVTAQSVGQVGKVVKNVFSFLATVVGAAANVALVAGAMSFSKPENDGEDDADPVLAAYRKDHPQMARLREHAAQVLARTRDKIVDLEDQLVSTEKAEDREPLKERLADLRASFAELLSEMQRLDTHFQAWKAGRERVTTSALDLVFELSQLPRTRDLESATDLPTSEQLGAFASVFERSGVVLARRDLEPLPKHGVEDVPSPGGGAPGVFFRSARPVELTVFKLHGGKLVPHQTTTELVMDDACRLGFLKFGSSSWSERSAEIAFWPSGALKTFKTVKESDVAAASEALQELPAELKDSLQKANEIIDQYQQLQLQGIEQRIAELQKQKSLVENEIALGGVLDTRDASEELARLKAEIDLLAARKDLGVAQRELTGVEEGSALQLETDLLKLRTELEKAQVERLKVEKELRELKAAKG